MSPPSLRAPRLPRAALALGLWCALSACGSPAPAADAGAQVDAGVTALSCDSPEDCRVGGVDGVCRQGVCRQDAPCGSDFECGLGEACEAGRCRFVGCLADAECPSGRCHPQTFTCAECQQDGHCPAGNPVCSPAGECIRCRIDADCGAPGPAHCELQSGACRHCLQDAHCPQGLWCGAGGVCEGAKEDADCNQGVACDLGLMCVQITRSGVTRQICARACSMYAPQCPPGEVCGTVSDGAGSLVFDNGAPLGICSTAVAGLASYHQPCGTCQLNLVCVPDNALDKTCKSFCDPAAPFCAQGELCHPFPGDYAGRTYGLCYPDNGYGERCAAEADCRAGLSCTVTHDPSTSNDLGTMCAFDVGSSPGLAPCTQDADCQSGRCVDDPTGAGPFCYAACASDADCSVDGRSGSCDVKFGFTTDRSSGTLRGCRPRCEGPDACAQYAPSTSCRVRVLTGPARAIQTCAVPPAGTFGPGEACTQDSDCAHGYCAREDTRGQLREGRCTSPCDKDADCAGQSVCGPSLILAGRGSDGVRNTSDDVLAPTTLCKGRGCTRDGDCAAPLEVCAPERDPADPHGALLLRCQSPLQGLATPGGQACLADGECASGACGTRLDGGGRACLLPCVDAADCPSGLSCVPGGLALGQADGQQQPLSACLP